MGFFSSLRSLFSSAPAGERPPSPAALSAGGPDGSALTLALRAAEPRLSAWLKVILAGVEAPGPLLWQRLAFFLAALETPAGEREAFIASFQAWVADMGYARLEDFRSELQYRLALALDLEDEEDERSRLVLKLSAGLAKTRGHIARGLNALFSSGRALDASFWDELEEILISADVGVEASHSLAGRLRARAEPGGPLAAGDLREALGLELADVFRPARRIAAFTPPEVVLMVGVNGVGKTTTLAKLCHRSVLQGKKALLVAGDTFRAAAAEQLEIWARRTGAGFYARGQGADPAAVAFESVDKALAEGYDVIFVDTAGRLHTKTNLMEELAKIRRVLGKRHPGAPHRTILVLDATSGQNALSQVKLFHEAVHVDEIILTKLDGTAKGGIAVAVASRFSLPISFVGLGEKLEDLRPFDSRAFAEALLG
ncbi:MAG: signal recognition particle-docking protein FtsY [Desulfovibrio sp.]|jgi:fused signal recognition particle receptor|nr:signal recognition particle-docking protein FtsY [Desulfovibrio sp.]